MSLDGTKIMEKLIELFYSYGPKVLSAFAILFLGWIGAIIVRKIIGRIMLKSRVDQTLVSFVTNVTYVAVVAFVVIAALGELGFQTASFVAVIGAAGLAIGFALQGSLSNFASGVLMVIFKPLKIGDYVDAGGTSGVVDEVGIFSTIMKTPDNKKIIVPNSKIMSDNITNYSVNDMRRVDIVAGVSYEDNLDKVRKVIEEILSADERILKDPAWTVAVLELADSSVNFAVRPWVKTADYWDVFFHLNETIKKRFDEEGISIPFPQTDVHLKKD